MTRSDLRPAGCAPWVSLWHGLLALLALAAPARAIDSARLAAIDRTVEAAIARGDCPGAVVLVLHEGQVVYRKAFGQKAKQPEPMAMTTDSVFDLASLTKPIATTTSVMLLVERGKLRLDDPVAKHLTEFGRHGKDRVTVEHLLLHTSGLIADNALADYQDGPDKAWARIWDLELLAAPGERFIYSDVGFLVLGKLVEKFSGEPLDAFARKYVFEPLGLKDTSYRPADAIKARAAPTERRDGRWLVGEVHDPRAVLLGGVAGHAGLFGTADDLAVYARMLLDGGVHDGRRVLSRETVRVMTTARVVPDGLRTPGWDVATRYSVNRGELFPRGESFGHTGFTGTSIWLDPGSRTAVVFLSNRVHPDGKGNVTRLRGEVATLAASAVLSDARRPVLTGLDVLSREKFARLKGRRVGLVTNHTGRDRDGHSTIDLLHRAEGVALVALFSPEHGIRGALDEKVPDGKDEKTGLPVHSLYGDRRKPTAEQLKGIDTLVYDIQDAGCRFYTYISTLGLVMEAASGSGVGVLVLDRPNPVGGAAVEGPLLDLGREAFVAYHNLPVRHGLTVGELALLFRAERKLTCGVEVVKMEGWRRGDLYDRTGLQWVNPSPNLRGLTAALLYPGVGLLETTNVSVGRGTDRPFEWVGAPWIDGKAWARALAAEGVPGVRLVPTGLTPTGSVHKGQACGGVQLIVEDWARFRPLPLGIAMAVTLKRLYPRDWQSARYDTLLRHKATLEQVEAAADWRDIVKSWDGDVERFRARRKPHLLYPE